MKKLFALALAVAMSALMAVPALADTSSDSVYPGGDVEVYGFYDKDGNGTIDANDKMILGHCAPTWTGSFTSNLSYKNIDFSFSIYTSQGGMVYSPFMAEFVDYGQRKRLI